MAISIKGGGGENIKPQLNEQETLLSQLVTTLAGKGVSPIQDKTVIAGTEIVEVTADENYRLGVVTVEPTPSQSKTVTPVPEGMVVTPDAGKLLSQVIIDEFELPSPEGHNIWKKYKFTPYTAYCTSVNGAIWVFTIDSTEIDLTQYDDLSVLGEMEFVYYNDAGSYHVAVKSVDGITFQYYLNGAYKNDLTSTWDKSTKTLTLTGTCPTNNDTWGNKDYDVVEHYTFIDYVVNDDETAYPNGGELNGYWYEIMDDGADIENGVLIEAHTRDGELNPGTFANLDIDFEAISEDLGIQSSSRVLHDVIQLDEDRYFIMTGDASNNYANFTIWSRSQKVFGTTVNCVQMNGNTGVMHKMDDGRILAITGASSGSKATVHLLSTNGMTVTFDASITTDWLCDTYASLFYGKGNSILKQLAGNKFLYVYGNDSATAPRYAVVFSVEGNSINQGTSVVLNTSYTYMKEYIGSSAEVMDETHFVVSTCLSSSSSSSRYMPEVFFCSVNGLEITIDKAEQLFSAYSSYYGNCLVLKTGENRLWIAHYTRETITGTTNAWTIIKLKLYDYSDGVYNLLDEVSLEEINGSWTNNFFRIFGTNENLLIQASASVSTVAQRFQLASEEEGKIILHAIHEVQTISSLISPLSIAKLNEQIFTCFSWNNSTKKFEIMPVECINTTMISNAGFSTQLDYSYSVVPVAAVLLDNNDVILFALSNQYVRVITTHLNCFVEKYNIPSLPLVLTKTKVDTTSGEIWLPA